MFDCGQCYSSVSFARICLLTLISSSNRARKSSRSAIHWDLVMIQTPEYGGGEIYFDDKLIRKDGLFVVKELLPLNPENLK